MAITSGYFNSVNGDRKYNADQMSEYFEGIINEGVCQHIGGGLAVTAGTGLTVSVATGKAFIGQKWIKNDAALTLTITTAADQARIDAVVLRRNTTNRVCEIAVKTGTPSASPSAPAMTRTSTTYEMALAYVNVAAGATSVTVTDKRADTTVCGWATVAQKTSGEVDAQLNALKTGFDGEEYDSPAAMVRGCDQKLQGEIDNTNEIINKTVYGRNLIGNVENVLYPMIPIKAGDKVQISTGNKQAATLTSTFKFYDKNMTLLSSPSFGSTTGLGRTLDTSISPWNALVGACFVSISPAGSYPYMLEIGETRTDYVPYEDNWLYYKVKYDEACNELYYAAYNKMNIIGNEAGVLYPFYPVQTHEKVFISTGNNQATDQTYQFNFYDASKTLLTSASFGVNTGVKRILDTDDSWSALVGACYVSIDKVATVPFQIRVSNSVVYTYDYHAYFPNPLMLNEMIKAINSSIDSIRTGFNEINSEKIVTSNVANGTAWNPSNPDCVCTDGYIDVTEGDTVSMTVGTYPDDGCHYGFGYVTYRANKTSIQSVDANSNRRSLRDLLIGTDVKYIRFTVAQFNSSGTVVTKRKTDYQSNDFTYYIKKNVLPVMDQRSIWMQQAKRISYATTNTPIQSIANMLGLIHLSDVHGDVDNIKRILEIAKLYPDYVNDIIHTGDSVATYIEAGNPFESVSGGNNVLNVVGNHDCWHQNDPGYYGTKQDAYDLLFKNNVSSWGVTQPTGASTNFDCYYYKDYTTNGFRLIVLDCMHWDTDQAEWFADTLTDAKTNSLSVIIGEHYASASGLTGFNSPFMSMLLNLTPSSGERLIEDAFNLIDDFIEAGGDFVCWLVGHQHADYIGTVTGHTDQLMIGIENAGTGVQNLDDNRIKGTPTQDCFNYITFDKTNKLIRFVRIGCNSDQFMRKKDTMCVNYSTKEIIA